MRGLNWQTLQLSLAGGLETKEDVRASDPRQLDVARDVQYDEFGGAQQRRPFGAVLGGGQIFGGGALANCRRVEPYGDELVLFTDTQVYSWNAQLSKWVSRGTHLAVAVDEQPRFVTTGDQVEADRAELNGTIVYAWTEAAKVFAAALDKATGSVLVAPTAVSAAVGRPRLVALTTKILLFVDAGSSNLTVRAIDPASPTTGIGGAGTIVTASASAALRYDVVRLHGSDVAAGAVRSNADTYVVFTVSSALAISTSAKARSCTGSIAVSHVPVTGGPVQVFRVAGAAISGDVIDVTSLADASTDQAIGSGTSASTQITAAHRSVSNAGVFTCHVFWSSEEDVAASGGISTNTVTTAGVIGTSSSLRVGLGIASRAFDFSGRVYLWTVFAKESGAAGMGEPLGFRAQLQNTYYLYRDDAFLVAKAAWENAGGFQSTGHLPGVSSTGGSSYAWCGAERRIIELGSKRTGYSARAPLDVAFSFDDDRARRTASIGRTLYVSGGLLMQYDGAALTEVGFQVYPWFFTSVGSGVGAQAAGTYSYKATMRWDNATGERERSTTATGESIPNPGAQRFLFQVSPLNVTRKGASPAIEFWRTVVDAPPESQFRLISSQDPNASGNNGYLPNDDTAGFSSTFADAMSDADLAEKEPFSEDAGDLEHLAPPGASIIFATDTRVFLAGVAGRPDEVWYSRLRGDNEVASFHDGNKAPVPRDGGRITALAFLNEALVVFRESAVYALPGQGVDNLGQGQNFGPANRLSSDVGAASMESVVLTPMGLLFKSRKGWYLLDRSWSARYVGAPVAVFDGDTVHAAHVVEGQHQVRILTDARMLVWDYHAVTEVSPLGKWAEWTIADGVHATIWQGQHVYLTATGPRIESTFQATAPDYGEDVETAWIKMQDLQGAARARAVQILGELRSTHLVRVRVARDYQYDDAGEPLWFEDAIFDLSPPGEPVPIAGSAMQLRAQLSSSDVQALKVRITPVVATQQAGLDTGTLAPPVATSGSNWTSTWTAVAPGEHGNVASLSLAFESSGVQPFAITVVDHFAWSIAEQRWIEDLDNVGVRVLFRDGSRPTVAQLEAAIAAETKLVALGAGDATPGKTLNPTMLGTSTSGALLGGTYGPPTSESCKLTGLGIEVGLKPGLHRRLSAEQKA